MSSPMSVPEAVRSQLEKRVGPVQYSDLRAHLERDCVFVVRADLDLIDCGVAVALDDVDQVGGFVASGQLRKPSQRERDEWPLDEARRWVAIVVQPFVLIQDALSPGQQTEHVA